MAQQPSIQSFFVTKAQPKRTAPEDSLAASPKKVQRGRHRSGVPSRPASHQRVCAGQDRIAAAACCCPRRSHPSSGRRRSRRAGSACAWCRRCHVRRWFLPHSLLGPRELASPMPAAGPLGTASLARRSRGRPRRPSRRASCRCAMLGQAELPWRAARDRHPLCRCSCSSPSRRGRPPWAQSLGSPTFRGWRRSWRRRPRATPSTPTRSTSSGRPPGHPAGRELGGPATDSPGSPQGVEQLPAGPCAGGHPWSGALGRYARRQRACCPTQGGWVAGPLSRLQLRQRAPSDGPQLQRACRSHSAPRDTSQSSCAGRGHFSDQAVRAQVPPSLQNIYKELREDCSCSVPKHGDLQKVAA